MRTLRGGRATYRCQATALLDFTRPLPWWDVRQYVDDYRSGNWPLLKVLSAVTFTLYCKATRALSPRYGAPGRWLYDVMRPLWRGQPFPLFPERQLGKRSAPRVDLALNPGDLVRVKSREEILATLNTKGANLGLGFDPEMAIYCGQVFRVKRSVQHFVDEKTGEMRTMKTPAVILDGAVCKAMFADQRKLCPREIYGWWREAWLEPVGPDCHSRSGTETLKPLSVVDTRQ